MLGGSAFELFKGQELFLVTVFVKLLHSQGFKGPSGSNQFAVPGDAALRRQAGIQLIVINKNPAENQLGNNQKGNQNVNVDRFLETVADVQAQQVGKNRSRKQHQPIGRAHIFNLHNAVAYQDK